MTRDNDLYRQLHITIVEIAAGHRRTKTSWTHRRTRTSRTHRITRIPRTHRRVRTSRTYKITRISRANKSNYRPRYILQLVL